MLLSAEVRLQIEQFADRLVTTGKLFSHARQRGVSAATVECYLKSIRYMLVHSPAHLQRSRDLALAHGLEALAEYYQQKLEEETGHDVWAEQDLQRLGFAIAASSNEAAVQPAAKELMSLIDAGIQTDCRLYLVYALFAEYFTVLAGPAWVQLLGDTSGVPKDALTVVTKHVEADALHAAQGVGVIDEYFQDAALVAQLWQLLHNVFALQQRFSEELLDVSLRVELRPERHQVDATTRVDGP